MSGISQLQRRLLRLALAVNAHTQGGIAALKGGATVPGYRVQTVDYAGPKDLRPALALWAVGGIAPSAKVAGFFRHDAHSRSVKAGIVRATTRLLHRGLVAYAPLPKWEYGVDAPGWGYVLTVDGMAAAGTEPLDVPHLAEACELFGITHRAAYERPWSASERHTRKRELVALLLTQRLPVGQLSQW